MYESPHAYYFEYESALHKHTIAYLKTHSRTIESLEKQLKRRWEYSDKTQPCFGVSPVIEQHFGLIFRGHVSGNRRGVAACFATCTSTPPWLIKHQTHLGSTGDVWAISSPSASSFHRDSTRRTRIQLIVYRGVRSCSWRKKCHTADAHTLAQLWHEVPELARFSRCRHFINRNIDCLEGG